MPQARSSAFANRPGVSPDAPAGGGGPGYFRIGHPPGPIGIETPSPTVVIGDTALERMQLAVARSIPKLPRELREHVEPLLAPETLGVIAAVAAVWAASHYVGVGFVVDVCIAGVGVIALGAEVIEAGKHFTSFAQTAAAATSDDDLDRAADHFATAVSIVGVNTVTALLLKRGAKKTSSGIVARRWRAIIRGLRLPVPANGGALWARLGDAGERAAQIAKGRGRITLEALLDAPENRHFLQLYKREFGKTQTDATKEIWRELSKRYANALRGEVEAYVNAPSLRAATGSRPGHQALVWDEIDEITDGMLSLLRDNPKVTSLRIYDTSGGNLELISALNPAQLSRLSH